MTDLIDETFTYSDLIKNGRSLMDIFRHAQGEMQELKEELGLHITGSLPGKDGIVGEAIDVMTCLVDLIHKFDPSLTKEDIMEIYLMKLEKWKRVHGKSS